MNTDAFGAGLVSVDGTTGQVAGFLLGHKLVDLYGGAHPSGSARILRVT